MRQFQTSSPGSVRKRLNRGRWEVVVNCRDSVPGESDGDGEPVWGKWKQVAHLTDVRCYADSNRGEKAALAELARFRKRLEAEEPERARREAAERGGRRIGASSTVGEYLEHYLDWRLPHQKKVERSTMSGYRRRAGYVAANRIADVPIGKLVVGDVERFRDELLESRSAYTARDTMRLLKAALADAERAGYIERSPAANVTTPSPARREPDYIDAEGRSRLLADLRGHGASPSVVGTMIALYTGMREGEICGLRWRDVDLDGAVVHVRRSIGRDGDGYYEKGTKTGSSRRDVPLVSDELTRLLAERRADVERLAAEAGEPFCEDWFVIGTFGEYMRPRALATNWRRRVRRLGIVVGRDGGRPPTFHDLRHTFATVAIASGADVKSTASILGHADASMTLNVYASADAEAKRLAMERIGRALRST